MPLVEDFEDFRSSPTAVADDFESFRKDNDKGVADDFEKFRADSGISSAIKGPSSPSQSAPSLKLDIGAAPAKPLSAAESELNRNVGPRSKFAPAPKPNANVPANARTTQQDIEDAAASDKIKIMPAESARMSSGHEPPRTSVVPIENPAPFVPESNEGALNQQRWAQADTNPITTEDKARAANIADFEQKVARGEVPDVPSVGGELFGGLPDIAGAATQAADARTRDDLYAAGSKAVSGATKEVEPYFGLAAVENPLPLVAGFGAGAATSYGAGKATEMAGGSPEAQQFAKDVGFFVPSLVGLGFSANERGVVGEAFGGRVKAGIENAPEAVRAGVKIGESRYGVEVPKNGAKPAAEVLPPAPATAAEADAVRAQQGAMVAMARQRTAENIAHKMVNGEPIAPAPAPAVPGPAKTPISNGQVSPELIDGIAKAIQSLPEEVRPQAMMEAHDRMTQALVQQGKVVGPDGQLHIVDSERAAAKLAQTWMNDKVSELDKKPPAASAQPSASSEEQQPVANPKGHVAKLKAAIAKASVGSEQERVVQESKATIDKQIDALKDGNISVVFMPAGSDYVPKLPEGFKRADVDKKFPGGGTYYYDPDVFTAKDIKTAGKEGTHGELLGHVQSKAEIAQAPGTVVVQAKAKDGTPIQDSEVDATRPDLVQKQAEIMQQRHPAATVEVKPTDQVIGERITANEKENKAAPVKEFLKASKRESFKKGDAVQFTDNEGQKRIGTVQHINELAARITDSEGKKYEVAPSKISGRGYVAGERIAGHEGKETELAVPSGKMPSKYRVVEAKDLKPSHDAMTFAPHAGYPSGVQERTYHTSKEAQSRVIHQAQNYEPAYTVNTNPDAVNGPPVVTPDGVVLGGNSRAMSTQRLYGEGRGATYRDYLRKNAEQFGIKPENVDKLKEPVLVREVKAPGDHDAMRRLGSELNKNMTGALGVSEKAVSAGKSIKPQTFDDIVRMMDDMGFDTTLREFLQQHGGEVLKMLQKDGVITERERPQFADTSTGGLSDEGRTFVERALLGSVVDDPVLMERTPKNILDKLGNSLGDLAVLKARSDEYNVLPVVRASLAEHADIAQRGITTDDYLKQRNMFAEGRNPLVDAMTEMLAQKPRQVKDAIRQFTQDAKFDQEGQGTIGLNIEPDAASAFNAAFNTDLTPSRYEKDLKEAGEKAQSLYRAAPLREALSQQVQSNPAVWKRFKNALTEDLIESGREDDDYRASDGAARWAFNGWLDKYVRGELPAKFEPLMDDILAETNWEDLAKYMDETSPLPQAMREANWQEYDPNQEWMKDYDDRLDKEREETGLYRTDELHDRKYQSIKIEEAPAQGGLFGEDTKMFRISATDENGDVARYLISEHELGILKNNPGFRAAMNGESQGPLFRGNADDALKKLARVAGKFEFKTYAPDGKIPGWIVINRDGLKAIADAVDAPEVVGLTLTRGDAERVARTLRAASIHAAGDDAAVLHKLASEIDRTIFANAEAGVPVVHFLGNSADRDVETMSEELFHSGLQFRYGGGGFEGLMRMLGVSDHPAVQQFMDGSGETDKLRAAAETAVDVWNSEYGQYDISDEQARDFADMYFSEMVRHFGDQVLDVAEQLNNFVKGISEHAKIDTSRWENGPAQRAVARLRAERQNGGLAGSGPEAGQEGGRADRAAGKTDQGAEGEPAGDAGGTGGGLERRAQPDSVDAGEQAPTFFSKAERVVEEKVPNRVPVHQLRSLLNNSGVKADELKWIGLDDFLRGKVTVAKDELLKFIRENNVQVKEVLKGEGGEDKTIELEWEHHEPKQADHGESWTDEDEQYQILKNKYGTYILDYSPEGSWESDTEVVGRFGTLHEAQMAAARHRYSEPHGDAQYEHYTLPGGENYRELLLTLPAHTTDVIPAKGVNDPNPPLGNQDFHSGHFDEPNVIAHIRFNDRTDADGKSVLFLEEVQSDWHQRGRRQGYSDPKVASQFRDAEVVQGQAREKLKPLLARADNLGYDYRGEVLGDIGTGRLRAENIDETDVPGLRHAATEFRAATEKVHDLAKRIADSVPDAPFKTTWHELALKRMLRWAAENGYDKMAWTPGDVQNDRYDLSKHISSVSWNDNNGKLVAVGHGSSGRVIDTNVPREKLADYLGKDVAERLLATEGKTGTHYGRIHTLDGLDLKVGGAGMKGFYDKIIPDFLNKYAKKWGAQVGTTEIDADEYADSEDDPRFNEMNPSHTFPAIPITPEMKRSVMQEGQPLFRGKGLKFGVPATDLSAAEKAEVARINQRTRENISKLVAEYKQLPDTAGGRFVSSDSAKALFPEYENGKNTRLVHPASAAVARQVFEQAVSEPAKDGMNKVTFVTGIPGAGKSTAYSKLAPDVKAAYEINLASLNNSKGLIDAAIAGGYKPRVMYVHSTPEQAVTNMVNRAREIRRAVPLSNMSAMYERLPKSLEELHAHYGDGLEIRVLDNSDLTKPTLHKGIEAIRSRAYNGKEGGSLERFQRQLEAEHAKRPISADTHQEILGELTQRGPRGTAGPEEPTGSKPEKQSREVTPTKKTGESGFAKADIPIALAEGAGKAVVAVKEFLRNEAHKVRQSRDLQGGIYTLESQFNADVLRATQLLKQVPGKASDEEAIYHHLEDPKNVGLTAKQQSILEQWIQPFMDEAQRIYVKLAQGGMPVENYVHRQVKEKGGMIDRIMAAKRGSGSNVLSKNSPSMKKRTLMALEGKNGERKLVSIKDGQVLEITPGGVRDIGSTRAVKTAESLLEKRLAPIDKKLEQLTNELKFEKDDKAQRKLSHEIAYLNKQRANIMDQAGEEDLKGNVLTDKKGNDWKLTQATTKEIEAKTDVRYHHNAAASAIVNYLNMRRAERAFDYIESFKRSPEFSTIAVKSEDSPMPPKDWRPTKLQQFSGYYFEPHTAEVLDWFADRIAAKGPSAWEQVGRFLRTAIFFNPLIHVPNITVHWIVEKGFTGWANPMNWPNTFRAGVRAANAVMHQNDDFLRALDTGAPLQSQRFETNQFAQLFFEKMAKELEGNADTRKALADALGYANPAELVKQIYRTAGKVTWWTNDLAFLQSTYEKTLRGMTLSTALDETAKHIPDYRLPTRIFDSPTLAKLMSDPNISMFGAYHYGALKSYAEMMKSALGLTDSPYARQEGRESTGREKAAEVGHGWDLLLALGLFTFVIYPQLDKLAKWWTGDKNAEFRRAGASTFLYNMAGLAKGERSPTEVLESVVTPAAHTFGAAQLVLNRDFHTGRKIYDPHAGWKTIAKQVGGRLAEMISPVGSAQRAMRSEEDMKKVLYGFAGIGFKMHGADKMAAEIAIDKMGTEAPDPEALAQRALKHDLMAAARNGDYSKLDEAEQQGKISAKEARMIARESLEDPLMVTVKDFTADELLKVYEAADPEQREMLEPLLQRKLMRLRVKEPEKAEELEASAASAK